MVLIIIFILLILFPCNLEATIITIPLDYPTIQQGVEASQEGDTVMVLPGHYSYVNFHGKNILLTSQWGPDSTFMTAAAFNGGTDTTAVLRGFTVSACLYSPLVGVATGSSGIIESNKICGNYTIFQGAGILSDGIGVVIKGNIISNNHALDGGGGMKISRSQYTICDNIIEGNIAGGDDESWGGGGIWAIGYDFVIKYNLIVNNQAGDPPWPTAGAGAYIDAKCDQGNVWVINNTFVKNRVLYANNNSGAGFLMYIFGADYICNVIIISWRITKGVEYAVGDTLITSITILLGKILAGITMEMLCRGRIHYSKTHFLLTHGTATIIFKPVLHALMRAIPIRH